MTLDQWNAAAEIAELPRDGGCNHRRSAALDIPSFRAAARTVSPRRRHAESFAFRIDEDGTRMVSYSYHAGKQLLCPTLLIFESQCSLEVADASTGQSPAGSN
jgi:hypothetical protein